MQHPVKGRRFFTDAARVAALAARAAKLTEPDSFGAPELFVVRDGPRTSTWELRRFGGLLLQRGSDSFTDAGAARSVGTAALAALREEPGQPTFKRQVPSRAMGRAVS